MKNRLVTISAIAMLVASLGLALFSRYFGKVLDLLSAKLPTVPVSDALFVFISALVWCMGLMIIGWCFSSEYDSNKVGRVRWFWIAAGLLMLVSGVVMLWGTGLGFSQFSRVASSATLPTAEQNTAQAMRNSVIIQVSFGMLGLVAIAYLAIGLSGKSTSPELKRVSIPRLFPLFATFAILIYLLIMFGIFLLSINLQTEFSSGQSPNPPVLANIFSLSFQLAMMSSAILAALGLLWISSGFFIKVVEIKSDQESLPAP